MASLSTIRPQIAAAIKAAAGQVQCDGYVLSSPTAPFFDIELDSDGVDPHESMVNGISSWTLLVRGCVASLDKAAQDTLDTWTATSGSSSVTASLESYAPLLAVAAVKVTRVAGYRGVAVANQPGNTYLGAEWTVEVYTQG